MAELTHDQARRLAEFVARLEAATAELGVSIGWDSRTMAAVDDEAAVYIKSNGDGTYTLDTRDA